MGLFGKKKAMVGGDIGYHGLAEWWFATFSKEDREYIEAKTPWLVTGEPTQSSACGAFQGVIMFLQK